MDNISLDAAIIIIGNEILSGKTQDQNIQYIALELGELGIKLKEVRIIADFADEIIETINILRKKYTYIFTTGGIGPTHDDITAATIAKAFGQEFILHPEAREILKKHLDNNNRLENESHIRMAHMPKDAKPLLNRETGAPGFYLENVFVMAGIPYIMRAMFEEVKKLLKRGKPILSRSIDVYLSEGLIAGEFEKLQKKFPQIEMGSYPFNLENKWGTSLVLRGTDLVLIETAMVELSSIISNLMNNR